jgi:hypothetical protein
LLQLLNLAVSTLTLTAVLAVGVWVGRVDEKLKDYSRRLERLETPYALRALDPRR